MMTVTLTKSFPWKWAFLLFIGLQIGSVSDTILMDYLLVKFCGRIVRLRAKE